MMITVTFASFNTKRGSDFVTINKCSSAYLDPRSHRNAGLQPLLHAHVIREEYALERLSL